VTRELNVLGLAVTLLLCQSAAWPSDDTDVIHFGVTIENQKDCSLEAYDLTEVLPCSDVLSALRSIHLPEGTAVAVSVHGQPMPAVETSVRDALAKAGYRVVPNGRVRGY